ncbi:hypothetical protein [Prevotella sp.]|uniref:hypothetical protein n=1 Tax=Prevotella sp. TaxID=59823 RepID=UPI001CB0C23F|nr:hypothetical protein [Prevotella sp.]MBF1628579.1 hypothetical protein [Prevotella sp.]
MRIKTGAARTQGKAHHQPTTGSPPAQLQAHHQPIYSLTPVPSPNGEGSENHCLQIKGAFRWCEERLFS